MSHRMRNLFPREYAELVKLRASATNQNDKKELEETKKTLQDISVEFNNAKTTIEDLKSQIEKMNSTRKRYAKSDRGKEAQRRASRKYYETKRKTGRPRGRPKKVTINEEANTIIDISGNILSNQTIKIQDLSQNIVEIGK